MKSPGVVEKRRQGKADTLQTAGAPSQFEGSKAPAVEKRKKPAFAKTGEQCRSPLAAPGGFSKESKGIATKATAHGGRRLADCAWYA